MIGDSENDILCANALNMPSIVVSFGYSKIPVKDLNADIIMRNYKDLISHIQEINNILKINIQTNIKSKNRKIAKRIPINPIRRFILFIIIKPELAIESDLKIFTSNENDHNLAKKSYKMH